MSDLKSVIVATVHGMDLSLHDLLRTMKLKGQLAEVIAAAAADRIIAAAAKQEAITVTGEELQRAADAFRLRHGLNKAADTQRWLALNRLDTADLEDGLERDLLRQKLAERITSEQVEKFFAENRAQFDRAHLRQIVVDKEGVAQELLSRIQEEGADFADLARQHSLEPNARAKGGALGIVRRQNMQAQVATAVFAAKKGDIVGPLKPERAYLLIKVEEILLGQLDGPTSKTIRQTLFRTWINAQVENGKVVSKLDL